MPNTDPSPWDEFVAELDTPDPAADPYDDPDTITPPEPVPPADDAPVEEWARYAFALGHIPPPDSNRSQIRTLLGIPHPLDMTPEETETPGPTVPVDREPYVGEGVDGARRSAQIDREEADGLDAGDLRDAALASAERWDDQADRLEAASTGRDRTLEDLVAAGRAWDANRRGPHGNATTVTLGEALAAQDPALAAPAADTDTDTDAAAGDVVDAEILCDCDAVEEPGHAYDPDVCDLGPGGVLELSSSILDSNRAAVLLDQLGANPTQLTRTTATMRDTLVDVVRTRNAARRKARIERLDGAEPRSSTDVRAELVEAADDADVLTALAGAFTAGAVEAKGIAGDLLDELPGRGGKPRASMKAADGHGMEIHLTRAKRTELSVAHEEVDNIIAAHLLAVAEAATKADPGKGPLALTKHPRKLYAAGIRDALNAVRGVLATSPTYRSTALDQLVTVLEDADDDTLATRLRKAYGRVDKGEPSVKIDRKPLTTKDTPKGNDE